MGSKKKLTKEEMAQYAAEYCLWLVCLTAPFFNILIPSDGREKKGHADADA